MRAHGSLPLEWLGDMPIEEQVERYVAAFRQHLLDYVDKGELPVMIEYSVWQKL